MNENNEFWKCIAYLDRRIYAYALEDSEVGECECGKNGDSPSHCEG